MNWPAVYRFDIEEQLSSTWSEWFEGMVIEPSIGQGTSITGLIEDEAALFGVINRLRDLNLVIIEVKRLSEHPIHPG